MENTENKKPENPQAFPQTWIVNGTTDNWENGMNLRDYFANSAMQGICVNAGRNGYSFGNVEQIAELSYMMADAMLKQREL